MMARIKSFFDKYTERFISRKFLVFILATIGVACGLLTEDNWTSIAIAYVGLEGFADLATRWKGTVGAIGTTITKKNETKLEQTGEPKSSSDQNNG